MNALNGQTLKAADLVCSATAIVGKVDINAKARERIL
jgi:hypothetical protein